MRDDSGINEDMDWSALFCFKAGEEKFVGEPNLVGGQTDAFRICLSQECLFHFRNDFSEGGRSDSHRPGRSSKNLAGCLNNCVHESIIQDRSLDEKRGLCYC